jgi:starch-binding outer membrane protein, SusD/RagB family
MKNRIANLLFFMVAVASISGCKKSFLEDMKSYDKYDERMFTSEPLTGAYIDRLYNYYFANYRDPRLTLVGLYENTRSNATEETGGTVTTWTNPTTQLLQASQADTYFGAVPTSSLDVKAYTRIRFCNFLIEKVNEGVAQALSEDFKKTAKGQMYFLRALQYFDLVRVYGGVPLVLRVQEASAVDESIKIPRAKTSEVFEQIVLDLDSAAALLPMKWANEGTDYGRLTAAGALAMKSRVLLTAASPLFNINWDNAGDARWQKALDAGLAAETQLTAAGYGASISSAKDWAEVTFKNDNKFNGEALIVNLLSSSSAASGVINASWENGVRLPQFKGTGGISVPKGMLDMFPLADGTRPVIGNNYNDTFFFENREPRFYRTFAFSGSKWGVKGNDKSASWLYRWKSATNVITYYGNNQVNSPAVVRKMSNPAADSTAFTFSGTDIFDYRYGELLLNIAEAYAAKGDIGNCVAYLVKVRKRVFPATASANNYGIGTPASKYAALEACLYERRVELAYEGKRFWDLQRWMLYDDEGTDNTNTKLGIAKLNGTTHQGYYWQSKTASPATTDPLSATDKSVSVDPDANAATLKTQTDALKALYNAKFVMTPLDQAWDRVNNIGVNILFRSNYYVGGLHSALISNNTWLTQTIGWQDYNGAMGTFDYRQ